MPPQSFNLKVFAGAAGVLSFIVREVGGRVQGTGSWKTGFGDACGPSVTLGPHGGPSQDSEVATTF
jgi:hypothetical protein